MSDTPRTDRDSHRYGDASVEWLGDWVPACACRIIERELNAANAKIKRLGEAGDEIEMILLQYASRAELPRTMAIEQSDLSKRLCVNWRKAKEAKL